MSKPNIESEVQKCLKDLKHTRSRVVPVKLGFYGAFWQPYNSQKIGDNFGI